MSYSDIYQKRLDRYGTNTTDRINTQRGRQFLNVLAQSINKISFEFNSETIEAILTNYKQDSTQTLFYLETDIFVNMSEGTVIEFSNRFNETNKYMIYYKENKSSSGYNRYILLKLTYQISWTKNNTTYSSWAYYKGIGASAIIDSLKSNKTDSVWYENDNLSYFIMPINENIGKEDYIELGSGNFKDCFKVVGIDRKSTIGIEYVSVDSIYEYDTSAIPQKQEGEDDDDFYWFNGGTE